MKKKKKFEKICQKGKFTGKYCMPFEKLTTGVFYNVQMKTGSFVKKTKKKKT